MAHPTHQRQHSAALGSAITCLDGVPFEIGEGFKCPFVADLTSDATASVNIDLLTEEYAFNNEVAVLKWVEDLKIKQQEKKAEEAKKVEKLSVDKASDKSGPQNETKALVIPDKRIIDHSKAKMEDSTTLTNNYENMELYANTKRKVKKQQNTSSNHVAQPAILGSDMLTPVAVTHQVNGDRAHEGESTVDKLDISQFDKIDDPFDNVELQTINVIEELKNVLQAPPSSDMSNGNCDGDSTCNSNFVCKPPVPTPRLYVNNNNNAMTTDATKDEAVHNNETVLSYESLSTNGCNDVSLDNNIDDYKTVNKACVMLSDDSAMSSLQNHDASTNSDSSQSQISYSLSTTTNHNNNNNNIQCESQIIDGVSSEAYPLPALPPRLYDQDACDTTNKNDCSVYMKMHSLPAAEKAATSDLVTPPTSIQQSDSCLSLNKPTSHLTPLRPSHSTPDVSTKEPPLPAKTSLKPLIQQRLDAISAYIGVKKPPMPAPRVKKKKRNSASSIDQLHNKTEQPDPPPVPPHKTPSPVLISPAITVPPRSSSLLVDSKSTSWDHFSPLPNMPKINDDPYNRLSEEAKKFIDNLTSLGFPRARIARAVERFGQDDKIVVDYLCLVSKLIDQGHLSSQCEIALQLYSNDYEQASKYLELFRQFQELGFSSDKIRTAIYNNNINRDKALDELTALS